MEKRTSGVGLQTFDLIQRLDLQEQVWNTGLEAYRSASVRNDVQLAYDYAVVYHSCAQLDKARTEYETVLELDPGHLRARNNLGACCYEQGLYAEAVYHFSKLTEAYSDEPIFYWNLMHASYMAGDRQRSLEAYSRWVDLTYSNRIQSANT